MEDNRLPPGLAFVLTAAASLLAWALIIAIALFAPLFVP